MAHARQIIIYESDSARVGGISMSHQHGKSGFLVKPDDPMFSKDPSVFCNARLYSQL